MSLILDQDQSSFQDSIAFGGNCLHSFNVKQQMRVHKLEKATNVEEKYWLNGFVELNWYAAKYLCKKLKGRFVLQL